MKPYPCKDCKKRTVCCHDYCKEFQAVKRENAKANAERAKCNMLINYFKDRQYNEMKKKHHSEFLKGHKK